MHLAHFKNALKMLIISHKTYWRLTGDTLLMNGISVLRQRLKKKRDPLATVSEDMVEKTLTKHKDAFTRLAPPP